LRASVARKGRPPRGVIAHSPFFLSFFPMPLFVPLRFVPLSKKLRDFKDGTLSLPPFFFLRPPCKGSPPACSVQKFGHSFPVYSGFNWGVDSIRPYRRFFPSVPKTTPQNTGGGFYESVFSFLLFLFFKNLFGTIFLDPFPVFFF